uniref:Cytochrome b n=1 Tax=Metopiellus crypticus TaxID=3140185 RepID=A0AAT9QFH6_9COLE|nr:cytochrome b [Metopiellus sp.]
MMMNLIYKFLMNLPTPSNISTMWNFGSMLGLCLLIQIFTGLFLSMHYCPNTNLAFNSIINISRNINYGWLIRSLHANGASFFFICIYIHISRNMYYDSFKLKMTWIIGTMILLLLMMTAFMGYILPWGQMSFWGITVITNLLSTIPYLGISIVQWLWGGFSINNDTLMRFYSFHFILPFMILMFMLIHLMYLHQTGSTNPLSLNSNIDKLPFYPFFLFKDLFSMLIMLMMMSMLSLINPYLFMDPENFIQSNPFMTPIHIQPEWYFLFAYSILRSIPNKLGGVIALILSIFILFFLPFLMNKKIMGNQFYPFNKILLWMFLSIFILLTWSGAQPVEYPFKNLSQMFTLIYFLFFFLISFTSKIWDKYIF